VPASLVSGDPSDTGVAWNPVCGACGDRVEAERTQQVAAKLKDFVPVAVEEQESDAAAAASAAR
jgi:hypothetical protein